MGVSIFVVIHQPKQDGRGLGWGRIGWDGTGLDEMGWDEMS
jgi:hypothetical protein